jgi:hypothetical protein
MKTNSDFILLVSVRVDIIVTKIAQDSYNRLTIMIGNIKP